MKQDAAQPSLSQNVPRGAPGPWAQQRAPLGAGRENVSMDVPSWLAAGVCAPAYEQLVVRNSFLEVRYPDDESDLPRTRSDPGGNYSCAHGHEAQPQPLRAVPTISEDELFSSPEDTKRGPRCVQPDLSGRGHHASQGSHGHCSVPPIKEDEIEDDDGSLLKRTVSVLADGSSLVRTTSMIDPRTFFESMAHESANTKPPSWSKAPEPPADSTSLQESRLESWQTQENWPTWIPAQTRFEEENCFQPITANHRFHPEAQEMGQISPNFRSFTKWMYEGRLSVLTESSVHTGGTHRYLARFTLGEVSRADGVGFVFSHRLPCAKNIQRIVSIFLNQRGRICMRYYSEILRASVFTKPIELFDWVETIIKLDDEVVTFNIWQPRERDAVPSGPPDSTAEFNYGERLGNAHLSMAEPSPSPSPRVGGKGGKKGRGKGSQVLQHKPAKLLTGHFACVVKNLGVTLELHS